MSGELQISANPQCFGYNLSNSFVFDILPVTPLLSII
jgi:hypothetical protein